MNNYNEKIQQDFDKYKELCNKYEELTSSVTYFDIISTMPFEFLKSVHLYDKLDLYHKLDKKPRMFFSSKEEAYLLYKNIVTFAKDSSILLEKASFIAEIGKIAKNINDFVENSPYLCESYKITANQAVIDVAMKCLKSTSGYANKCTKEFRWNFIESCILSLDREDILWLAQLKVIKATDIEHISLTEKSNDYENKINALCEYFKINKPAEKVFEIKLKGVTFPNNDGSSRQSILKEIKDSLDINPTIPIRLNTEKYIYTPEIGLPEDAIAITWNDKCIGNLGKDVVAEINEKYPNAQLTATLKDIYGGENGMAFGCKIELGITTIEINKENVQEVTK